MSVVLARHDTITTIVVLHPKMASPCLKGEYYLFIFIVIFVWCCMVPMCECAFRCFLKGYIRVFVCENAPQWQFNFVWRDKNMSHLILFIVHVQLPLTVAIIIHSKSITMITMMKRSNDNLMIINLASEPTGSSETDLSLSCLG